MWSDFRRFRKEEVSSESVYFCKGRLQLLAVAKSWQVARKQFKQFNYNFSQVPVKFCKKISEPSEALRGIAWKVSKHVNIALSRNTLFAKCNLDKKQNSRVT